MKKYLICFFLLASFFLGCSKQSSKTITENDRKEEKIEVSSEIEWQVAWCAMANRSCSILLNMLRQQRAIDSPNEKISEVVILQDLYRLMFASWIMDKKNSFAKLNCNPPHKWVSKSLFRKNLLSESFIANPLGTDSEKRLHLGDGNYEMLFENSEAYEKAVNEFHSMLEIK